MLSPQAVIAANGNQAGISHPPRILSYLNVAGRSVLSWKFPYKTANLYQEQSSENF
jgi:hypothetical protein